jgi:hypothetical protein
MSNPKIITKLVNYQNIDQDNYLYEHPQRVEGGNTVCYDANCYYDLGDDTITPVFFETKPLITTTGIYSIGNEYMMDLEIPRGGKFLDFLLEEDELNINTVMENSEQWFGDEFPLEVVQEKYKASLLFRNQGENPILRTEIPSQNGMPKIEIFNEAGETMNISDIESNSRIACIVRKKALRFMKETFNTVYMVYKIKVFSTSNEEEHLLPPGDIFSDAEESDSDDEPADMPTTFTNVSTSVNDDDSSDDDALHLADSDLEDVLADSDEEQLPEEQQEHVEEPTDKLPTEQQVEEQQELEQATDMNDIELDLQEVNLSGGDSEELEDEVVNEDVNANITPQEFPDFDL